MASYFGEIVTPSSRAFWVDEDEDGEPGSSQETANFQIRWLEDEPSQIKQFIVVEGDMNIEFVKACLLTEARKVCIISSEKDPNPSCIFLVDEGLYLCLINPKLELAKTGEFSEAILHLLQKSSKLIAVTCNHVSQFKSASETKSGSFLRSLCSKRARESQYITVPFLSQPNFVTGVSAGVLSYAEIFNLDCVLYILYTDTFVMDSTNAEPLTELFSNVMGKSFPNFHSAAAPIFNKGNLYT